MSKPVSLSTHTHTHTHTHTQVMSKPVSLSDGTTYEESAIREWLNQGLNSEAKACSPVTGLPLTSLHLTPNRELHSRIRAWQQQQGST